VALAAVFFAGAFWAGAALIWSRTTVTTSMSWALFMLNPFGFNANPVEDRREPQTFRVSAVPGRSPTLTKVLVINNYWVEDYSPEPA
jgi:hypothetical protein